VHVLTDPWHYQFFRNGIEAGALAGALCGLVGVYVVLRRMSYIGHGLSHAIFGGAVASYVLQINFYIGAGIWGLASALLINSVARRRKIGADAAIGIVTTASFAVGVALISRYHKFTVNFDAALFGNILGVSNTGLLVLLGATVFTVVAVFLRYQQLLFATFDPDVADSYGVNVRRLDVLFALILAATVVSTMQILGVTLIAATIVIPAIVARLVTDSFGKMLVVSTVVGAACGFAGMYTSFYFDVASGSTIVLVAAALFVVVFAATALMGRRRLSTLARQGTGAGAMEPVGGPAPDLS
jgi:manganese/iron transport system permease protein/iron/zinc/copper transport system permease protein